jgi:hypothetical protein
MRRLYVGTISAREPNSGWAAGWRMLRPTLVRHRHRSLVPDWSVGAMPLDAM